MFILALPKTNQKASASFLGDPKPFRRLNQTHGLSPRLILRRLQRIGYPACVANAQGLTHVGLKHEKPLFCRRIAVTASSRRRGTQSVKRRCRAKYGSCYTRLIIQLKMNPYYFAPPKLRFWVAEGRRLDFLFRFASRQNEKQADRRVRKIQH
ncbi:hypothetical protein HMPREF9455_02371 [Dysgonomonas gadei ATCC BAA-286]|uniref:Uncharacterized protein n=1 Tax=Dysgonomonas gadei ATCC BAA-286 TaxID=742766 RepID=F5IZ54_9BACT|nr:hypothetical protein HMPREF9455_02371 [Dysgonomonas gadei ATCC BAA-286]